MLKPGLHKYTCHCGKYVEWNVFPRSIMTLKQNQNAEKHVRTQLCPACFKTEITDKDFIIPKKPLIHDTRICYE